MSNPEQAFGLPVVESNDIDSIESRELGDEVLLLLKETNPTLYKFIRGRIEAISQKQEKMEKKEAVAHLLAVVLIAIESAENREKLEKRIALGSGSFDDQLF